MNGFRRVWLLNRTVSWKQHLSVGKRHLYSYSYLGLDTFNNNRQSHLRNNQNVNHAERLKQVCFTDSIIFLEDIRKMLYLVETDDDLDVLLSMLKKYANQNKDVLFHTYDFGTEVLRLLHSMNKPDEAVKLIKDDSLFQYFQSFTSVLLLLDLLFENHKYSDMISIYKYCTERREELKCGREIVYMLLAACYKSEPLDDSDFQLAYESHMSITKSGVGRSLRNAVMFAALAIKKNKPFLAVETFYSRNLNSAAENYKMIAFAQAKRTDNVLQVMQNILRKEEQNIFLTREALSFVEKEVSNSEENILNFQNLKRELEDRKLISDQTLEELLFETVKLNKTMLRSNNSNFGLAVKKFS